MVFPVSRFKNIKEKKYEIEVITPLFSGGADVKHAELREPAIKGVMRFWWRALYGSDNLTAMKIKEDKIFGSTENKSDLSMAIEGRESLKPVLQNISKGKSITVKSSKGTFSVSIIEYLSYGLCEYQKAKKKNIFTKEHFQPGTKFRLCLRYSLENETEILDSLRMIDQFGGLGARSRNGLGVVKIDEIERPEGIKKPKGTEKKLFKEIILEKDMKSFTSFSSKSRIFLFQEQNRWDLALSDAGLAYKDARTSLENKHFFNKRPLIAKPLIVKGQVNINDRHAKPYFLHVNKTENSKYRGQILYLPYNYYKAEKKEEYLKACSDMNDIIQNAAEEEIV